MVKARKTFAGGRPRSQGTRCPCAVMTLRRAQARGRSAEHDPSCAYYPEPRGARKMGAARKVHCGGRPRKPSLCPKCGVLCVNARAALGHC